ncbi:MAG: HD domain-containing protein [Chlamydiales bacterium]|nr:HD domain-containing protein [Chlamydiia bacterium]MCP5507468.1 HD domain-containing protein [Chlamydiales bacterium]
MKEIVNLLNEAGMLARIPRSGFAFLGSGKQSVAEHTYRMTIVAFALAKLNKEPVDMHRLTMICLFHDLAEARTGDLNYVNKKYVTANESAVLKELREESPFGSEICAWIDEYNDRATTEAKIAHDADQIELLLVLKEQMDIGNSRAQGWFDKTVQRLTTPQAKAVAETIRATPGDAWWLKDLDHLHWVDGRSGIKT